MCIRDRRNPVPDLRWCRWFIFKAIEALFLIVVVPLVESRSWNAQTLQGQARLRIANDPSPLIPEEPCPDGKRNLTTAHTKLQTLTIRIGFLIFSTRVASKN